jgi:hypothetical protein
VLSQFREEELIDLDNEILKKVKKVLEEKI